MKATNELQSSTGNSRKFFAVNHELLAFIIANTLVLAFAMALLLVVSSLT